MSKLCLLSLVSRTCNHALSLLQKKSRNVFIFQCISYSARRRQSDAVYLDTSTAVYPSYLWYKLTEKVVEITLGNFDREYILEQKANVFVLTVICFPTFADKNTEINISKLACICWFSRRRRSAFDDGSRKKCRLSTTPQRTTPEQNAALFRFFVLGDLDLWHLTLTFELRRHFCTVHLMAPNFRYATPVGNYALYRQSVGNLSMHCEHERLSM